MMDNALMLVQPVQISIDKALLERLDADPEVKAKGRSAFIREALRVYFRARERARIDEQIRSAYGGRADAMLREVESLLGSQSWPEQ